MRVFLYFVSTVMFMVALSLFAFSGQVSPERIEQALTMGVLAIGVIVFNAVIDFTKWLLRIGEYNTPIK